MKGVSTGVRDHLFGALLAVAYVAVLLPTSADLAMSRDESFYVVAAERYGEWIRSAAEDFGAASERDAIDRHWSYNHEHPALVKSAFALSLIAQQEWDLFSSTGMAIRFPGMVSAGLLLWLIYIFGARLFGREAAAFAAVAFALIPRAYYHAHLDCFDVPITLTVTWVIYCYWRSLEDRRWAIWTGVAFGLSLATKHNTWILPGIFLIHYLWMLVVELRSRRAGNGRHIRVAPYWLVAIVLLGPLLFVGSWPWLWNDTVPRIEEYVRFHVQHEYYNMAYFGRNYFEPPFPVGFPWVMTAYTVPLTTLVLSIVGLYIRARCVLPRRLGGEDRADAAQTDVLLLGALLAPFVVISLPTSPIFGGTKHWFPAYPFLVLFAGLGFVRVAGVARESLDRWRPWRRAREALGRRRAALLAGVGVGAVLLAPSFAETAHSHPFGLSHYGFVAGGVPGAADDGMNRQFWGFTHGSLAQWLEEQMPDGGTVWICDATQQAWRMMHADGMLPRNIRATGNMAAADFTLVHHEHHFAEVEHQAWVAYGSVRPAHVLTYDGVPIVTVYENPRRRP